MACMFLKDQQDEDAALFSAAQPFSECSTMPQIEGDILQFLALNKKDTTAKDIWLATQKKYTKREINRCLYHALTEKKLVCDYKNPNGAAPCWKLTRRETEKNQHAEVAEKKELDDYGCSRTIVFIDLGNVHDCLANCKDYTTSGLIDQTFAFADYHFNGYGINPKIENIPNVQVLQVTDVHKNSGDMLLVWTAGEIVCDLMHKNSPEKVHFIVATKDDGFRYLKQLVEKYGHVLDFVKDWAQLRTFVE